MLLHLTVTFFGFILPNHDFIVTQLLIFQLNIFVPIGIVFMIVGGSLCSLPRRSLAAAGFVSIWKTPRMRIVNSHKLVTERFFKHIQHPIHTGEILRDYCIAFIVTNF